MEGGGTGGGGAGIKKMLWHIIMPNNIRCIVGSGVAGLYAATQYMNNGDIPLIIEKANTYGGKLVTKYHDGLDYDMGANGINSLQTHSLNLMKKYHINSEGTYLQNMASSFSFESPSRRLNTWSNVDENDRPPLFDLIVKNIIDHIPPNQIWSYLSNPAVNTWSETYVYGFGYANPITREPLNDAVRTRLFYIVAASLTQRPLKHGFRVLADALFMALPSGTVIFNESLRSLERHKDYVMMNDRKCNSVLITASPTTIEKSLLTNKELSSFAPLRNSPYFTSLVECRTYVRRTGPRTPSVALLQRQHGPDGHLGVYGYYDRSVNATTTIHTMQRELHEMGCIPNNVLEFIRWEDYAVHFPDFAQRKSVDDLQGVSNVYWTGAYLDMEFVDSVIESVNNVLRKHIVLRDPA